MKRFDNRVPHTRVTLPFLLLAAIYGTSFWISVGVMYAGIRLFQYVGGG